MSFDVIPKEVIQVQLSYLSIKDILKCRLISKEFRDIIDDNNFWYTLIKRDHFVIKEQFRFDCKSFYIVITLIKSMQKTIKG